MKYEIIEFNAEIRSRKVGDIFPHSSSVFPRDRWVFLGLASLKYSLISPDPPFLNSWGWTDLLPLSFAVSSGNHGVS